MRRRVFQAEPRPKDWVKIRCDKTSDEKLFTVGKVYAGYWGHLVDEDGKVTKWAKRFTPIDENGESYNTYRSPWYEFTIVEGPTEPPKE